MCPSWGLIIAISLQSSTNVFLGVHHPPLHPPPLSSCTPHVQKKQNTSSPWWVGFTNLHFRDTQSDRSIAMMGVKRASLTWYLCQRIMMDAVLNKCACNVHDHLVALERLSQPAFTPLHHYGATLLRAPALTFTRTNRSFCACDCFTLVSVIKINITSFLAEC